MRNGSQNATFHRLDEGPSDEHPRGEALATRVADHLRSLGYQVTTPDNWRDGGWDFECSSGEDTFQVIIAGAIESGQWFLQISSTKYPGFFTRVFGRGNYPFASSCFRLAGTVHSALASLGAKDQRWRWDGPPRAGDPNHLEPPTGGAV
jgi:hypothetical protein